MHINSWDAIRIPALKMTSRLMSQVCLDEMICVHILNDNDTINSLEIEANYNTVKLELLSKISPNCTSMVYGS